MVVNGAAPISAGSVAPQRSLSGAAAGSTNAGRNPNPLSDVGSLPAVRGGLVNSINAKLAGSPMAGNGEAFVSAAEANDISPWFLVAIAKHESNFGRLGFATNGSHNAFGMGVTGAPGAGIRYPSWAAGIRGAANNLGGPLYKGAGKVTIEQVGARWAADPNWAKAVARNMAELAGTPADVDLPVIGPKRALPSPDVNDNTLANKLGELNPLEGIASILKFIADPKMWIRVGSMILGAAAMIVGITMLVRSGDAGRPIGLIVLSLGFVWLYAAVKAINPADMLKGLVGA